MNTSLLKYSYMYFVAIVVGSICGSTVATLYFWLFIGTQDIVGAFIGLVILGIIFGFSLLLLFGIPLHYMFRKYKVNSLYIYILGGFICTLPLNLLISGKGIFNSRIVEDPINMIEPIAMIVAGMVAGAIVWRLTDRVR